VSDNIIYQNKSVEQIVDTALKDIADACRLEPTVVPDLPYFSDIELTQMHRYCLKYRDLVRGGGILTDKQHDRFMRFQRVCYMEGVAHE
jgi:hypothetical protein